MMTLNISGKEYKVKFGFNSFADSDLLDRVSDIANIFSEDTEKDFSSIRTLFTVVRELLYVGFKKCNPVESLEAVGDLLDVYIDETPLDEDGNPTEGRGILELFMQLSNELADEGFLADFVGKMMTATESETKKPQDHKKPQKKK